MGASGSTEEDNTDNSGNESTQDESRENAADSSLKLASVDCLTCSDTKQVGCQNCTKEIPEEGVGLLYYCEGLPLV